MREVEEIERVYETGQNRKGKVRTHKKESKDKERQTIKRNKEQNIGDKEEELERGK